MWLLVLFLGKRGEVEEVVVDVMMMGLQLCAGRYVSMSLSKYSGHPSDNYDYLLFVDDDVQ